jgi:hypothetical protein
MWTHASAAPAFRPITGATIGLLTVILLSSQTSAQLKDGAGAKDNPLIKR